MNVRAESPGERVYKAYWQDGSIDLFAGLALTFIGIGWLVDEYVMAAIVPALLVPLQSAFRTRFVEPRLGYVRFDAERRGRLRAGQIALVVAGTLAFVAGIAVYFAWRNPTAHEPLLKTFAPALPAVLVGLGGVLSALVFRIARLAAYGLIAVACGIVTALLRAEPGWSMLAAGLVITVSGSLLLLRFFREFPLLPSEME